MTGYQSSESFDILQLRRSKRSSQTRAHCQSFATATERIHTQYNDILHVSFDDEQDTKMEYNAPAALKKSRASQSSDGLSSQRKEKRARRSTSTSSLTIPIAELKRYEKSAKFFHTPEDTTGGSEATERQGSTLSVIEIVANVEQAVLPPRLSREPRNAATDEDEASKAGLDRIDLVIAHPAECLIWMILVSSSRIRAARKT
jgi:hypothetical protein